MPEATEAMRPSSMATKPRSITVPVPSMILPLVTMSGCAPTWAQASSDSRTPTLIDVPSLVFERGDARELQALDQQSGRPEGTRVCR